PHRRSHHLLARPDTTESNTNFGMKHREKTTSTGASLVELHDPMEALMTDPEGNRFRVVLQPDNEA
ncbi:hypothetical protein ACWDZ8_21990, partial [Streptomyces sp. NPDC003233]